ncbi:Hypothetical protein LUCI_2979 [Lucifera butyrica]|uniref:Hemerythrin-like domain-containing protein n=1 Tax=Lucifera butyrica TaxID=1351585 RepID=A0A498R878_9FIRM|nr:DUF438 domain-containing protein [Lucifera butyrica]VBB07714.1 Hypothetical protein LUCI_2979 [Lucifera butyrica]
MSELIKNREYRQKAVKEIIRELHQGKPVEEVKEKFDAIAKDLEPAELSLIEQSLINEGLAIKEVQRLCDVHAAVFRDALEKNPELSVPPGHPVDILVHENRAIDKLIRQEVMPILGELAQAAAETEKAAVLKLAEKLNLLWDVDKHYRRKEDLIFPFLEKYEITGPPKVMWGVDDKIRDLLKEAKSLISHYQPANRQPLVARMEEAIAQIDEMIFKEEKILFPMAVQTLSEDEWYQVLQDSDEIGYCLVEPRRNWKPVRENVTAGKDSLANGYEQGYIKFGTGVLSPQEIELIFSHLPVDITFVDKHGAVKFFSAGKERIFPRARTIIGRKVENCHPPASVHIVEKIVEDFKNGSKDQENFWLELGGKFVYIRYFAVKDETGDFAGVLEVTQDIKPIQAIAGEKRIAD